MSAISAVCLIWKVAQDPEATLVMPVTLAAPEAMPVMLVEGVEVMMKVDQDQEQVMLMEVMKADQDQEQVMLMEGGGGLSSACPLCFDHTHIIPFVNDRSSMGGVRTHPVTVTSDLGRVAI